MKDDNPCSIGVSSVAPSLSSRQARNATGLLALFAKDASLGHLLEAEFVEQTQHGHVVLHGLGLHAAGALTDELPEGLAEEEDG